MNSAMVFLTRPAIIKALDPFIRVKRDYRQRCNQFINETNGTADDLYRALDICRQHISDNEIVIAEFNSALAKIDE